MDQPLVSVIMPAYNAEKYIEEAIQSVINQTYQNWELIIIDDGSTDETKNISLDYEKKDNRIKYLHQQNGKQGKARNNGINHSTGEYIAFLDADDLWIDRKLDVQMDYLIKHKEIDLIFSQGYFLQDDRTTDFDIIVKPLWDNKDLPLFIESNRIPILSVIVKATALIEVGFFIESEKIQFGEDYYLWLKLLSKNYKFLSLKERLFFYRVHDHQVTRNELFENLKLLNLFKEFYSYYDNKVIHNHILYKFKWGIFDKDLSTEYFDFCYQITAHYSKFLGTLIKLINFFPIKNLKNKLIVRLFFIQ